MRINILLHFFLAICCLFLIQEIISENKDYARKQGMYKMLASPDANNTTMPPKINPRKPSAFVPAQQIEQPSQLPKETISLPETKNTIVEKKEEQAPSLPLEPDAKKPIENETVKEDNEQPVKQETQAITSAKEIPEELQKLGDRKTKIEKEHNESNESQIYENGKIEFNFENADLQSLVKQMEELYNITFIADDNITPLAPGGKQLKGYKISFKTQKPLTLMNKLELINLIKELKVEDRELEVTSELSLVRSQLKQVEELLMHEKDSNLILKMKVQSLELLKNELKDVLNK